MAESIQTGGLMKFRSSGESRLSNKEKIELEKAYSKADERKKKEKRKRNLIWILILIFILLLVAFFIFGN